MRTLLRPGPAPLPGDSWDIDPSESVRPHHGASSHRRARWRPALPGRNRSRAIGIAAVAIGVVVVAGIWLLPIAALPGPYGGPRVAGTDPGTVGATRAGPAAVASGVAPVVGPGGAPGEGGARTTPGPGGSRSGGASGSGGGSGSGPGTLSGDGAPPGAGSPTETADPTFAPFTESGYEAEAGLPAVKLLGSAEVAAMTGASGGQVVRNLGKWSAGQPGSLQLRVNFPVTGTYRVALSYVAEAVAGQATLVVSGTGPYPVVFPVGSGCCPVVTVEVTIVAGARNLTVSNSAGPVPAIDRIVLTAI